MDVSQSLRWEIFRISGLCDQTVETDVLWLYWEWPSGCGLICCHSLGKHFQSRALYWKLSCLHFCFISINCNISQVMWKLPMHKQYLYLEAVGCVKDMEIAGISSIFYLLRQQYFIFEGISILSFRTSVFCLDVSILSFRTSVFCLDVSILSFKASVFCLDVSILFFNTS